MKGLGLVAGFCGVALVGSNSFAAAEGLGLQVQLSLGAKTVPRRMELSLQAPRASLGQLAEEAEGESLSAPLLVSEWWQGRTRTRVLGVAVGGDLQTWRLNADGTEASHTWLWVGAAVVGAALLAVGLSGGGEEKNDDPSQNSCETFIGGDNSPTPINNNPDCIVQSGG